MTPCRCRPYPDARFVAETLVSVTIRHDRRRCGLPPEVLQPAEWLAEYVPPVVSYRLDLGDRAAATHANNDRE